MIVTRAQALARSFAPVGLEELDRRASLQHRMDDKYVATWDQFALLAEHLVDTHEVLEIAGHRTFTYDSIYFDSQSLGAYRDHVQRRRRRFKVRTRRYVETDTHQLQVKLEGRRAATVKHVVDCHPDLHGAIDPLGWEFVDRCLRESYGFELGGRLDPRLRTSYRRMTLGLADGGERVTCDFDMALEAVGGPVGWMRDDRVLLEVKSARGNGPANSLLRRLGIYPVSCSKYCVGVAMTVPGVTTNSYRRLIGRHFEVGSRWIPDHLWQQILSSYTVAAQVEGTVTSVVASGAFVEVFPGVEGLVHASDLAVDRVVDAREIFQAGDSVTVEIVDVDARRRCLSLAVKRVADRILPPPVPVVPSWV